MKQRFFGEEPWHSTRLGRSSCFSTPDYSERLTCSFVGTTAALIMGGLAAAGAVGGAAVSAHAAGSAADKQATAADTIQQQAKDAAAKATDTVNQATTDANTTIDQGSQNLTDAQKQQLAALKPYIDAGQISLTDLQQLLGTNGPLAGPGSQFKFTPQDWQNDPGYDYIKQQADTGLGRQLAARGGLLGGGSEKAFARLDTGLASTHLDSAFQRALETYTTNRQNVLTRIQGLTGIVGTGFQGIGLQNQDIGNTAQLVNANLNKEAANKLAAGEYAGNTGLQAANITANAISGKAAAQGAADIGTANAVNQGIGGVVNAGMGVAYGLPYILRNTPGVKATGNTLDV